MSANPATVLSRNAPLPKHDYSDGHVLLKELRKPRQALREVMDPSGVIAARRIRELAWDLGVDLEHYRWMAFAARELGLNYSTMVTIIKDKRTCVSTQTVDAVARKTCIPVAAFYDPRY
jgi:hypothetical protein